MKEFADSFVAFIFSVIVEMIKKRTNCSTRLSCQLAVTEFSPEGKFLVFRFLKIKQMSNRACILYTFPVNSLSVDNQDTAVKNQVNFGFTFNLESRHALWLHTTFKILGKK